MLAFNKRYKGDGGIMIMARFKLDNGTEYLAKAFIDGYLINPFLLRGSTPAEPFILCTEQVFTVHYLIKGCLRCWGVFDTIYDALNCAKKSPFLA